MARLTGDRCISKRTTVHQKHIEPPVTVEVQEQAARAQDLGQQPLVAGAADVGEVEAGGSGDVAERLKRGGSARWDLAGDQRCGNEPDRGQRRPLVIHVKAIRHGSTSDAELPTPKRLVAVGSWDLEVGRSCQKSNWIDRRTKRGLTSDVACPHCSTKGVAGLSTVSKLSWYVSTWSLLNRL